MAATQSLSRALKRSVRPLARFVGDQIKRIDRRFYYKPRIRWIAQPQWIEEFRPWIEHDGRGGTRLLDRRLVVIEMARAVRSLRGSTAECGVAGGVGSALICKVLEGTYAPDERHLAFDSFEGVSAPIEADRMANGRQHWHQGKLRHELDETAAFLADFPVCTPVKGWIPETFPPFADHRFRMVHIDVDLYEPTRDSLQFLYQRVVPRGILLFDDHGFIDCPGARQAALEFFADKPESLIELPTGQAFAIKL